MTVLRVDTIAGIGQTFGPLLDGDLEFNSQNYIVLPKGSSNQQGVLRTTEDVIGVGGTYYDNLVLAMPFNEATGLRDVSSRNRNPGYGGTTNNVSISSTISKYYGSSAKFDGSGDYLSIENNSDFRPGSNDFTVESWVNPNSISSDAGIAGIYDFTNNQRSWPLYHNSAGRPILLISDDGTSSDLKSVSSSTALSTGQWNHIVGEKQGTTIRVYVNGVVTGTLTTAHSSIYDNTTDNLQIGAYNTTNFFNGYIQDLRIYKGIAKYTANFTPPERIAEIGVGFKTGALRYNTDSNKPELYDGNQWTELQISNVGLGTGGDTGPGARGVFGGGSPSGDGNVIEYINISSTGNAIDFGDLIGTQILPAPISSSTRGIFAGGYVAPPTISTDVINYVTIASTGDAQDFGDLIQTSGLAGGVSSSTRGVVVGGFVPGAVNTNVIQYLTIASTGNTVDYGDLPIATRGIGSCNSSTRGIFAGGYQTPALNITNTINFVTISTLGDAVDFGDLSEVRQLDGQNVSSATRGVFGGGRNPNTNTIDYVTISSLGNAINFGDLTQARVRAGGCSSSIRGVFGGGANPSPTPTNYNIIDYILISSQGNAVDFGDLTSNRLNCAALSNAHGGL